MLKDLAAASSLALLLLAGCASTPHYPAPPSAGSISVSDSPFALDKAVAHTSRIGDTQVYLLQTEGGSLALGLLGVLTGPFGAGLAAAANSHMVNKKTEQMAAGVSPNQGIDVEALVKLRIAERAPSLLGQSQPAYAVAGAVLIAVDADDKVRSTLVINARDASATNGWSKSYFYHFSTVTGAAEFQAGGYADLVRSLAGELDHAVDETTDVLVDDLSGKFVSGKPIRVKSDFLRPVGNVVIAFNALDIGSRDDLAVMRIDGTPGLILFPTVDGVHLFQSGQYAIQN